MITKNQRVVIIRGDVVYNKDVENPNIMMIEYSGMSTLLTDEPSIFINEEGELNLTEFLKTNIKPGEFLTIRIVSSETIEGLFNDQMLIEKYKDNRIQCTTNGKFDVDEDGNLMIGSRKIKDVICNRRGLTHEYMYMEIYVTN